MIISIITASGLILFSLTKVLHVAQPARVKNSR